MEHLMNLTAITYPIVTTIERSCEELKFMLEDIADNLFNKDPYTQPGGDMGAPARCVMSSTRIRTWASAYRAWKTARES